MKYEWLDQYLLDKPGAEKDFKIEWGWHRYMVRGKLFGCSASCSGANPHAFSSGRKKSFSRSATARQLLLHVLGQLGRHQLIGHIAQILEHDVGRLLPQGDEGRAV
mgnify:CR=1 FL=1